MAAGLPPNKHIYIIFSRSRSHLSIMSKLVMLVEKRRYSHAAVEIAEPATKVPLVFQASRNLVNFFYKPTFLEHNTTSEMWLIEITPMEYISIWSYAVRKMGSDYGWMELISILTKKLFKIKSWFKNGDKTNICSELAARVLKIAGVPMPENLDECTPSDLNFWLTKCENGSTIRRVYVEGVV